MRRSGNSQVQGENSAMRTIYLTPHTHYDVAWAFSREDYLMINEDILQEALALMKKGDFKFCLEQTYLLEEIGRRNPKLWAELKDMIEKGKLEIVDGQYLMPDTMLPTGEVLVREILFGKRYCCRNLGIEVPVAWAADSFGMNAQLPQIYRKSGYRWLAFRRGARRDITQSEFLWRGLDGTTILAHWMPLGYRAGLNLDKWEEAFTELNKYAATSHILMPCGSGSMPPQPEILPAVKEWNRTHPDVRMKIATPREFFQALESEGRRLEVIEGELYDDELVDVFPQVCSTRAWIVRETRECENLLLVAEEFATIAWLLGAEYPAGELRDAWLRMLFIGFHDVITGCGVDEIYPEVRHNFSFIKDVLTNVLCESLAYIAGRVSTKGPGSLVAFNPLTWTTKSFITAKVDLVRSCRGGLMLEDGSGRAIEAQLMERGQGLERNKVRMGFVDELPPLGYKVYALCPGKGSQVPGFKFGRNEIENQFFKVSLDEESGVIQVFDAEGRLTLRGNELVIEDEIGDLYYHKSRFGDLIKSESGEGLEYGSFKPRACWVERGKLRAKLVFESEYYCLTWPYRLKRRFPPLLYKYKVMDIHKEVIVYRDIPRIEFVTHIVNRYPNIRLRVRFDTGMERKIYFRETQFGVVPEPTEYYAKRNRPRPSGIPNFLSWFDISNGVRGITFMNRGLPTAEIVGQAVYLTLFRSVNGLSADGIAGPLIPTPDALELGPHTFEYAIQFHQGDWREAEVYRKAQDYRHLPLALQANGGGELPSELSFLEIKPYNLVLSALKKAEEGEEVILRFFETLGQPTKAQVKFFRLIKEAWVANLLEERQEPLALKNGQIELEVKPFEIVTLRLRF